MPAFSSVPVASAKSPPVPLAKPTGSMVIVRLVARCNGAEAILKVAKRRPREAGRAALTG